MAKQKKLKKKMVSKKSLPWIPIWKSKERLLLALLAMIIGFAVFYNCLSFDFVNWDDPKNIQDNVNLRSFDAKNIKGIFTSTVIGNYNPLTILSFAIEKHLFGLNPKVFHLNNILLHCLIIFLVYCMFSLMGLKPVAALFGAALFAIHPMRSESVAWITERKDVLFGVFYFAALVNYLKYILSKKKRRFLIYAFLLFIPALFSKIQAVSLPLSMLAIDYLYKRKFDQKLWLEKLPFFIGSLVVGILGFILLKDHGSLSPSGTRFHFLDRLFIGGYSYVIYLVKAVVPFQMSPLYPYPPEIPLKIYALGGLALSFFPICWFLWKKNMSTILFGLLFFTVNVMFMLQIVGAGQGFLADRFTYVGYFGLFFIVAYYFDKIPLEGAKKIIKYIAMSGVIAVYAFLCFRQNQIWKNSDTLWTHVIKYYPNTKTPWRNRANYFRDQKKMPEALRDYSEAIRLAPSDDGILTSRGKLYFNTQEFDKALTDYTKAIELVPGKGEYWINRGAVYAVTRRPNEALNDLSKGLSLDPEFATGYLNRSIVYQQVGEFEKSLSDIISYLRINPYNAELWYQRGKLELRLANPEAALTSINKALSISANNSDYYLERSKAFYETNQRQAAQNDLRKARSLGNKSEPNLEQLFSQ